MDIKQDENPLRTIREENKSKDRIVREEKSHESR